MSKCRIFCNYDRCYMYRIFTFYLLCLRIFLFFRFVLFSYFCTLTLLYDFCIFFSFRIFGFRLSMRKLTTNHMLQHVTWCRCNGVEIKFIPMRMCDNNAKCNNANKQRSDNDQCNNVTMLKSVEAIKQRGLNGTMRTHNECVVFFPILYVVCFFPSQNYDKAKTRRHDKESICGFIFLYYDTIKRTYDMA